MSSTYDLLRLMPLLQGVSLDDFHEILEKCPFDFQKASQGDTIQKQNAPCQELIYLVSGTLFSIHQHPGYTIEETIEAPLLIEPYSFMGYNPCYHSSYVAKEEVSYLVLRKQEILDLLCNYPIIRINLLNILSRRVQILREKQFMPIGNDTREKILYWLQRVCDIPHGEKQIHIRMEDLGQNIGHTRVSVSQALALWKEQGFVSVYRKRLHITDLRQLR